MVIKHDALCKYEPIFPVLNCKFLSLQKSCKMQYFCLWLHHRLLRSSRCRRDHGSVEREESARSRSAARALPCWPAAGPAGRQSTARLTRPPCAAQGCNRRRSSSATSCGFWTGPHEPTQPQGSAVGSPGHRKAPGRRACARSRSGAAASARSTTSVSEWPAAHSPAGVMDAIKPPTQPHR